MLKYLILLYILDNVGSAVTSQNLPDECAVDLYRMHVCQGKSTCESHPPNDQSNGAQAAWDGLGWCAPSHHLLMIELGDKTRFFQLKIQSLASRPAPEYVKLDYYDDTVGDYERYLMKNNDNIRATPEGIFLDPPIETDKLKLRLVLPHGMPGSTHACMKFELFTCDTKTEAMKPSVPPNSYIAHGPLENGIPLEFAIFDTNDGAAQYWAFFPFKFLSISDNLVPAYLYISKVEIEWRVVPTKEESNTPDETNVTVNIRTNVQTGNTEEKASYQINTYRWTKFAVNMNSCNFVDIMMLCDVSMQIRIKQVKFYTTQQRTPLIYQYNGGEQTGPHIVELAVTPKSSANQMLIVAPIAEGSSFMSLTFRGRILWGEQEHNSFDAEYASGPNIADRRFDETVKFQRLRTPDRTDTLWRAVFDQNQYEAMAFYFPTNLGEFKISAMVAGDQEDISDINELSTEFPVMTTTCGSIGSIGCLPVSNQTAAGVVVGIIGALVVVSLVAAILIWRRKRDGNGERYTPGMSASGGLYADRNAMFAGMDLNRNGGVPRNGVSLPNQPSRKYLTPICDRQYRPDNIPPQDRRNKTVGGHFNQQNRAVSQRVRPPNPPPEPPPENIYEPPINFRENSPRLYGPCGTIRYAQPDALRVKEDPPSIEAECVNVLEELGSGEFGEVFLVEAPISSFPNMDHSDLPHGATKVLAALKRLKANSNPETKKTFLAEAKLMYGLRHRNILPLIAIIPDLPALLSGYSEHGDLRQYLRRRLTCDTCDLDDPGFISYKSLLDICIQIAAAMEYLESVRVVHRDLAARNCFVGRGLTVRVGDFGMSRNLYSKDYFKVTGNAVLPIRWSAWESIILGKFTTQSDIWSYGVTCYEVYILCRERPLDTMTDEQVIQRMVALYKERTSLTKIPWLPKPKDCSEDVWEIIMDCWQRDPSQRPPFKRIHQALREEQRQRLNQENHQT